MTKKRNYIEEIVAKKEHLLKRTKRFEQFMLRVGPLIAGFRFVKSLDTEVPFRSELLKYCPIGYIACVEGYFRLLFANLIDNGSPFMDNIIGFRDVRFGTDVVAAIQSKKVSLGEFMAHLLPIRNVSDINRNMSTITGEDFLALLKNKPFGLGSNSLGTVEEVFPDFIGKVGQLFRLRHIYAHELASKEKISVRKIEKYTGSTAIFIFETEELVTQRWLKDA